MADTDEIPLARELPTELLQIKTITNHPEDCDHHRQNHRTSKITNQPVIVVTTYLTQDHRQLIS